MVNVKIRLDMKMGDYEILKYASYDIAEVIVCGRLLKFNNPSFFNDPFDCDLDILEFDFKNSSKEVKAEISEFKKGYQEEIPDNMLRDGYIFAQKEKIKLSSICCFSMRYNSTTMWSHYGDSHKGIALIFDYTPNGKSYFEGVEPDRITSLPVKYEEFSKFNYLSSKEKGIRKLFGTKTLEWDYEEEYRIILLGRQGLIRFKKEFLSGVVFGMRVSEDMRKRFIETCLRNGYDNLKYGRMVKENLSLKLIEIK